MVIFRWAVGDQKTEDGDMLDDIERALLHHSQLLGWTGIKVKWKHSVNIKRQFKGD